MSIKEHLNILQLGTTDIKGGAAVVSWYMHELLRARGHDMRMIVGHKLSGDNTVRDIFDSPINRIVSKIIKRDFHKRLNANISYYLSDDISFLPGRKILGLPEFKRADIIQAHNLHSNFLNLKALPEITKRKPFIWTLHDMWPLTGRAPHAFDCEHWPVGGCDCVLPDSLPPLRKNNSRKLWKIKKDIYDRSDITLVVPSKWLRSKVEQSMLKDKRVHLIYNGIDIHQFKIRNPKSEIRNKLSLPKDKKIVLFSAKKGRKNIWKGWEFTDRLIEEYKNNSDVFFVCVGGEDYEEGNLKGVTYKKPHELAQYMQASDVFLYPTIADNCPLVVLEAQATGLLVLSFDTGGLPELVKHQETGYIAPYKDHNGLLTGFRWLLGLSESETQNIAKNARKWVEENFSIEGMVDQYEKLYLDILKS